MIIGVNTRLLLKGKLEGIGYFQHQLLQRITRNNPNHVFIFFFDRKYDEEFVYSDNVRPVVIPLPTRHPVLWKIYFDTLLPLYCKRYKIDVFFSPENYIPKYSEIPIVCTIHDLNFLHNQDYIGNKAHQLYFMKYFPMNAHKCDKIVTVSNFSKKDIEENFSVDADKIEVVYNAANTVYKPQKENINQRTKTSLTGGKDYFYFVGAIHKRKNLTGIFMAFDEFKRRTSNEVCLVIIGNRKWWKGEIEDAYNAMQYRKDVIFTGRLEAKDTALIASASLGLVFPSLFEGFGIPVVEAMSAGCPVITSFDTSLPEVAGDAALLVNPYNVDEICTAMQRLYEDSDLRNDLIRKGYERAKIFDWNESANKLWNIIENASK